MTTRPTTLAPGTIYELDCLTGLEQLEPRSVDLVFADPPFNIGYEYDVYDDRRAADEYLDWCRNWITGVARALSDNGTFWLAIGDEFAAELKLIAQRDCGFHCRSWVIWYYTFGVNCVRAFSRSHTHLFHFIKDPQQFTFNADNPAVRIPSARQLVYGDRRANPEGRLPDNTWVLRPQDVPDGFSDEQDTWYFARVAGTFKEREGFHGCQMPEQLLGRIIRTCSNPNDLVLDPFSGSGTSLAVAKKLGRRFIGFDISPEYVQRATDRIAAIEPGDPLSGPENPAHAAPTTRNGRRLKAGSDPAAMIETARQVQSALEQVPWEPTAAAVVVMDDARSRFKAALKETTGKSPSKTAWQAILAEQLAAEDWSGTAPAGQLKRLLHWNDLQSLVPAAEIATQIAETELARPLPQILLYPKWAKRFDEAARHFGAEDIEAARWTALQWCRRVGSYADAVFADAVVPRLTQPVHLAEATGAVSGDRAVVAVVRSDLDIPLLVAAMAAEHWPAWISQLQTAPGWLERGATSIQWSETLPQSYALVSRLVSEFRPALNSARWVPGRRGNSKWATQELLV